MFEFADEAYAPANAVDEIKAIATGVIGHHDEDAIALYIKERYERHQNKKGILILKSHQTLNQDPLLFVK